MRAVDIIVVLLTVTICVCLSSTIITNLYRNEIVDEGRLDVISNITSAMMSIVSLYIGAKLNQHIMERKQ